MHAVQEAARLRQAEEANDPVITHPVVSKMVKPRQVLTQKHTAKTTVLTETAPSPVQRKLKFVQKLSTAPVITSNKVLEATKPRVAKNPVSVRTRPGPQVSHMKETGAVQYPEPSILPTLSRTEAPKHKGAPLPQPRQKLHVTAIEPATELSVTGIIAPPLPSLEYQEDYNLGPLDTAESYDISTEATADPEMIFEFEDTPAGGFTVGLVEAPIAEATAEPASTLEIDEPAVYVQEYKDFAAVLGITEPILNEQQTLEVQPLPPICVEVAAAMQELAPEPAEAAQEMLQNIMIKIDEVVEQRISGSELAPASEEELEQLCIELFEYLGIEHTPETVMEFVAGIMRTKKLSLETEESNAEQYDDGTHEIKLDDDQTPGRLAQIFNFPKAQKLAGIVIQFAA